MIHDRGTIIFAADPFKESDAGRPWVVVNTPDMPFHNEQCITMALTSRTWIDERIPIHQDDVTTGKLPRNSSVLPWAIASIDPDDVRSEIGVLNQAIVDQAVSDLVGYLGVKPN